MATVEFKFEETDEKCETTDIELCANRWKLYGALYEIDRLWRDLVNGKTCEVVYLYHKTYGKDDFGREVAVDYSRKYAEGDKCTGFVPTDFIMAHLSGALEEVRHLLD